MTTLKICSQQPSTEGLITLEEVIAVNLHILTVKYHWQVLAISLQMQSPHLSLLHRNHVKKLTQLLFYTSIFYDHFSFHYRWNCYMSCWTACFLIWLFLCFTVSVHSSFIFIRSAKGWKRLSCMKVLVNYLRRGKALQVQKVYGIVLVFFPSVFSQYLLPKSTIQGDSDFLENVINHGTKDSSLIKTREKLDLPWLMRCKWWSVWSRI